MNLSLMPIMQNPRFPQLLEELNKEWAAEQQRRAKFREELTPNMKAEFIEGQVIMHSPAMARHILATGHLYKLIHTWVVERKLGMVTVEKALVGLTRNDFEPDIAFFKGLTASTVDPKLMVFPAPDFVIEVLSPSTERMDRGLKMLDYAEHGVKEYWLIDCDLQSVERYLLNEAKGFFELAGKHTDGDITSSVIEGFAIPVAAIFDEVAQHEALKQLLQRAS